MSASTFEWAAPNNGRHTLLVEVAYRGLAFHGVARQPGYATVSETVERHLTQVLGTAPRALTFAARTDRGVSAEQNFATCWFRDITPTQAELSALLVTHADWQLTRARWVARSVNARNGALGKHYRYRITPSATPAGSTSTGDASWTIVPRLDVAAMRQAAALLEGRHDFSAFRAAGCEGKDPIKTLDSVSVSEHATDLVVDVRGRAFLRKMVRILVGTLAEVGAGLRSVESVSQLLLDGDRHHAGMTAPAHGLCLVSIELAGA